MFYAAKNNAIVGRNISMVATETKKKRDDLCKYEGFEPITAKTAAIHDQFKFCRRYPDSVFGEGMKLQGVAFWTDGGEFYGIK